MTQNTPVGKPNLRVGDRRPAYLSYQRGQSVEAAHDSTGVGTLARS